MNSILEQIHQSEAKEEGEYSIQELRSSHDKLFLTVEVMKIQLDAFSIEIKETKVSYHLCLCGLKRCDVRSEKLS